MNIKLCATLMAMFVATSAFADADHAYPESAIPVQASAGDMAQAQQPAPEKTRAQVRQELIEAERAGLVPSPKNDYPPSQAAIERNKARFRVNESYLASKN
ncbi:hypothetical protein LMG28614_07173 [Paraburkholderia ultramafica]|uniref:DUF4148 domain-containing protein n=1 Tax=Paraburkholderia ultramafica TaxID=1544867 RepID=A0A6S7CIJ2_9BURK|nr:DUF4148 domain-containing protein [Paraburkholderia ultramafica]CAB3809948.1 hypothetical protein LMG28614_07173 [Paraburkholderia ultramafica]